MIEILILKYLLYMIDVNWIYFLLLKNKGLKHFLGLFLILGYIIIISLRGDKKEVNRKEVILIQAPQISLFFE